MRERKIDLNNEHLNRIQRTSLCFVVFALVDLVKVMGCRLLSLRVNAESLFDLLKVHCASPTVLALSIEEVGHNVWVLEVFLLGI